MDTGSLEQEAITFAGMKKSDLFLADVNTQLKSKNVTTDIKVDISSNVKVANDKEEAFYLMMMMMLECRASVREEALSTILKALTLNIEQKFVEMNFVTLVYQCLHFIKKGSPIEMKQATHIIGLLSMITTSVEKVHEAYEDVLNAFSQGGLKSKTLEILGCLAVVTFFGASNSDETESVMKLLWDIINPGIDSSV
ncbi:hypothetical protein J1N35_045344 [Gossypium stocksii]|uniref:Interferon-related developmental regulator N-terminal domain-containing protein n=1 Tax=Gossypium stocksii TaxID=47602 RepID=A0A9D3ZGZ2_9ROSI|nr:hypothetical protein J1N35_045344 [Gossypium stocksii]